MGSAKDQVMDIFGKERALNLFTKNAGFLVPRPCLLRVKSLQGPLPFAGRLPTMRYVRKENYLLYY